MQNNIFYATMCHVCKVSSLELKRCSNCKTFAYCSKEHQKQHWREHKQFCNVIKRTNTTVTHQIDCNIQTWKRHRLELQSEWKNLLKRDLFAYEYQVWMFPRICAHCFSNNNLKDCQKCLNVAYCCLEHEEAQKKVHEPLCKKLKLCMEIERHFVCNRTQFPIVKSMPHSDKEVEEFPEDIGEILRKFFGETKDNCINFALKGECSSTFATIAYVIKKFILSNKENQTLVIHVVGADSFEASTDWDSLSQNVLHCFPNIKSLEWILIGPNADYHTTPQIKKCDFCLTQNKSYTIKIYKNLYQNVINELSVPDLVVALNCGIHEFYSNTDNENTWKSGISSLFKSPAVPVLLTGFTKLEILQDLKCIEDSISVKVLMGPQVNKFASLRPIRNWDDEENIVSVFYINGFIAVLEKHTL